jgi:hypothetical protein
MKQLVQGLQQALKDVLQHYVAVEQQSSPQMSLQRSCGRIWHLTKVLTFLFSAMLLYSIHMRKRLQLPGPCCRTSACRITIAIFRTACALYACMISRLLLSVPADLSETTASRTVHLMEML